MKRCKIIDFETAINSRIRCVNIAMKECQKSKEGILWGSRVRTVKVPNESSDEISSYGMTLSPGALPSSLCALRGPIMKQSKNER